PHDLRAVRVLDPGLAIDPRRRHREMRLLRGVRLPLVGHWINAEGLRYTVKPRHAGLVHQTDPEVAIGIDFEVKRSFRVVGLLHRNREIRHLPRLRIELGQELLAEMRVADHAVGIDDDVVGLSLLPWEIVFPRVARAVGRGETFNSNSWLDWLLRLTLA